MCWCVSLDRCHATTGRGVRACGEGGACAVEVDGGEWHEPAGASCTCWSGEGCTACLGIRPHAQCVCGTSESREAATPATRPCTSPLARVCWVVDHESMTGDLDYDISTMTGPNLSPGVWPNGCFVTQLQVQLHRQPERRAAVYSDRSGRPSNPASSSHERLPRCRGSTPALGGAEELRLQAIAVCG